MNKVCTALLCISLILLTLTLSIALPIYIRPFYYMQIEELGIPEKTGYDKETVKAAYDQVLDYLTLPGKEFGTGVFPYSEEGKSHFEDVRGLFVLNGSVLLSALAVTAILLWCKRKGYFRPSRPFGKHYLFSCGGGTLLFMAVLGAVASVNFEKSFEVFHHIFFPGKDNWIFSASEDGIILAMPMEFFLRCGLLFLCGAVSISLAMCLLGRQRDRRGKKGASAEALANTLKN